MKQLFVVPGKPVPQGSMKAVPRGKFAVVVHDNEQQLGDYRARIALAARSAGIRVKDGPVEITVHFLLPRPKTHFGTGRNAQTLRPSAPEHPTGKPDVDKLVRALLDGLTHIAFRDDSQVVRVVAQKFYADYGIEEIAASPSPCTEVAIAYLAERKEVSVV
jgi:crossover junction endodeoxyribonuclease RusA